jgi:hypothetical protein
MKNATFNFNFGGAPLPPRRSSRKTPTELPARPSSRKTPKQLAPRPSTRKTPAAASAKAHGSSTRSRRGASITESAVSESSNVQTGDAVAQSFKTPTTITGKRKRGENALIAVQEVEQDELEPNESDLVESLGQSVRKSIEGPFGVMYQPSTVPTDKDADDDDELSPAQPEPIHSRDPTPTATSIIQTPSLAGPRRRQPVVDDRSVSQKLMRGRSRTRKSVTATINSSIIATEELASDDELSPRNQTTSSTAHSAGGAGGLTSGLDGIGLSSTFVPNYESTRREVYEAPDTDEDELTPAQRTKHVEPAEMRVDNVQPGASDDELTPKPRNLPKKRGRLAAAPIQVREDTAQEPASGDELTPQRRRNQPKKRGRPPLSKTNANATRQQGQAKTNERVTSPATKKRKVVKETSTGTVPILVYRRTKPQDVDDDPLGADPTPGLNPADVLAQISGELTNAYINTFTSTQSQSQSQANRKTRQRQINALVTFRDNLADSLFDLTIAQNTSFILAMRVRKANKEKRRLREELIARRREREEVELRIDAVKAKRQEKSEKELRQHDLVQGLEDIEVAIRRGREKARREEREDEGPYAGVQMLATEVFGMVGNGGILGRVREWNGVLEDAAGMIEGKA